MSGRRKGRIVVLHLAAQYPFAGVVWQLLHHLVGFRRLGCEVFYLEDHGAWTYDPITRTLVKDPARNVAQLASIMARFGFADAWGFWDRERDEYLGLGRERCLDLLATSDAVVNLCGATALREEHYRNKCLIYLETDPGAIQVAAAAGDPGTLEFLKQHHLHFTYGENIGDPECALPSGGITWRKTRPPVLIDEWAGSSVDEPSLFTTVCTWRNKGADPVINGRKYYWSKDVNFRKFLEVARLSAQPIELATDLSSGPDYASAIAGGFRITPVIPMSLDADSYRDYIRGSRGEFTAAKDIYAGTRSGWFSDRSVCYLAAGRPVVTQSTGFERQVPTGTGLFAFNTNEEAVEAIRTINGDYARHAAGAQAIAREYFAAERVLDAIAEAAGL